MKTHPIDPRTIVTTLNSILKQLKQSEEYSRSNYWKSIPTQFEHLDLKGTTVQELNLDKVNMFIAEIRKEGDTQSTYQTYIKGANSTWLPFDPQANKGIEKGTDGIERHTNTAALISSLVASNTASLIVDANKITAITNATV